MTKFFNGITVLEDTWELNWRFHHEFSNVNTKDLLIKMSSGDMKQGLFHGISNKKLMRGKKNPFGKLILAMRVLPVFYSYYNWHLSNSNGHRNDKYWLDVPASKLITGKVGRFSTFRKWKRIILSYVAKAIKAITSELRYEILN